MSGKVPERFFPGKFDLFGYGHQLFHLCIWMMAWNVCEAAVQDYSLPFSTSSQLANILWRQDHLISFFAIVTAITLISLVIWKLMKTVTSKEF